MQYLFHFYKPEKLKENSSYDTFLLRNLHVVLSEDLHVCSGREGAKQGGQVAPEKTENPVCGVFSVVYSNSIQLQYFFLRIVFSF